VSGIQIEHRAVYTEAMVRDAVRTFVWRRVVAQQKGLWLACAALLAYLLFLLSLGERGWLVGALAVVVTLPPLILAVAWRAHSRQSLGRLRAMPTPQARFSFDEEGLAVESGLGGGRLAWSAFEDVWERPGYWMLFTGTAQFMTLPLGDLAPADLQSLRERLRTAR